MTLCEDHLNLLLPSYAVVIAPFGIRMPDFGLDQ
jgi:hypothetical protein